MRTSNAIVASLKVAQRILIVLVVCTGLAFGADDPLACSRLDTFEVHPLQTAEHVTAFVALLEHETSVRSASEKAISRALEKASELDLREQRALLAFDLLSYYASRSKELTKQIALATILTNDLEALPKTKRSQALNIVGNTSLSAGDHTSALAFYQRAYEAADTSKPLDKLYPLGNLAATYLYNQDTTTALEIIHRSIKLVSTLDIPEEIAYNNVYDFSEIGNIYLSRQQIDSAKYYLTLAAMNSLFFKPEHSRYQEIQETLMPPYIRFQIKINNHLKVTERIDSLRRINSQLADLLEAEYNVSIHKYSKALSLTNSKFESDLLRDKERIILRRNLANKLGKFKIANQAASELLAITEDNFAQSKKELVTISKAQMEAFEKERQANINRYQNELELLQTRQRNWIFTSLILLSLGIAIWFNQRYKKSHLRSLSLSKMVTQHEEDLIVANEKLASKVSSMERFNHLLSHDLREPLRSISGFTSILKRKAKPYADLTEDFNLLSSSVKQLAHLMAGVEQLRRVEEKFIERSKVDLKDILESISLEVNLKYSKHTIKIDTKCNLPYVQIDKELLYKSLLEVVDNAAKFSRHKVAHITIEATLQNNTLIIYVQDNGIGIDTDFDKQIFGVFKRLNRRENFIGSGVGLALAKLAIEKCGGSIALLESHVNQGSTFQLSFPLGYSCEPAAQVFAHTL